MIPSFSNTSLCHATWNDRAPSDLEIRDRATLAAFQMQRPWGMDTAIDLYGCNPDAIRDTISIRTFAIDLCQQIEMQRYGDPQVVRFGKDPRVSGITLVQLIETSDIVAHFIEQTNAACFNIFSCSVYPPYQTATFCQQWFGAQRVELSLIFRGPSQQSEEPV
jgi:S-adenosylmethionine/arginine decarboxylase-like enzyme